MCWLAVADGITLGGKGIVLRGPTATNSIFKNTQTGARQFTADPNMTAAGVIIVDNPGSLVASRATKSLRSEVATEEYVFDFCDELVFDTIQSVRHSFVAASAGRPKVFPVAVAGPPQPCKGAPSLLKVVTVYLSVAAAGTVTVDVDSSAQAV
jgi:hypothetical protein